MNNVTMCFIHYNHIENSKMYYDISKSKAEMGVVEGERETIE